ncbi:uncharacterized protein [Paramormyrops kingsleyae]|uniref:uncharacterized protein n=1 Tax=Paramormyrops kingsleyae TaxID=1676925 RepID=UPI003B9736C4
MSPEKSPEDCWAVLRAAKNDFLAVLGKVYPEEMPLECAECCLVLYYLEATVILKHLQPPGVVEHMTVQEWMTRSTSEADHTVIVVKEHKTSAQQAATFALSSEEETVSISSLIRFIIRLSVLAEEAGKWIKAFEEETMGRLLAIGDIKAVLACVFGVDGMERLLRSNGLAAVTGTPVNEACHSDGYCANCWHQLRLMFPPRLSVVEMKVEPIKEGESPAAYLQAQEKRRRTETEQDLQNPAFRERRRTLLKSVRGN